MSDLKLIGLILLAIGIILYVAQPAKAHEWYDKACCKKQDCAPVTQMKRSPNNRGWIMSTKHAYNVFVPDDLATKKRRASQDSQVHLCIDKIFGSLPWARCVYWPVGT
jgi:hypothetical protein